MIDSKQTIAKLLLQINAIKLNPATPFTWASGWKSPIYCDNRKTLSFPKIRKEIVSCFKQIIDAKYGDIYGIAAVATGAIGIGALIASELDLPMIYIRAAAKGHGLGNRIEGAYEKNQRYVVIEDLISTGKSSLSAVTALREAGCEVAGMVAIFSYNFPAAVDNFLESKCQLDVLSDYDTLIGMAVKENLIEEKYLDILKEWRENPSEWMQ